MGKRRLGKGLDALLPMDDELPPLDLSAEDKGDISMDAEIIYMGNDDETIAFASGFPPSGMKPALVPLDKLIANPNQPRKNFEEASLRELADSIREHGVIQPLLVEEAAEGTYTIIAGERRSRAAHMAGLTEVPALIRSYTDQQRMEISLVENIQRADLNPVEEAMAYRQLMDLIGLSQDEVAVRVGKNRATVANTLRLLKLPPVMLKALQDGSLSPGHGRALLSVVDPSSQETLFRDILEQGIPVREAEKRAGDFNASENRGPAVKPAAGNGTGKEKTASAKSGRDPELNAIEQRFIDILGTKVTIDGDLKKGKIHIEYYSMDDLDRLLEIIKPEEERKET
jgi:ParB family chromosome partitioning protein